jgi:peptide chain release factor 3
LQFEVVAHRLKSEYGVEARMTPASYSGARWVSADDPAELRRFSEDNKAKMATDAAGDLAYLLGSRFDLELTQKHWPLIHFHAMREHAGLELQDVTAATAGR